MTDARYIIGIDLGTSHTVVAYVAAAGSEALVSRACCR